MPDDVARSSVPMSPLPSRPDGRQPTGRHPSLPEEEDGSRALRISLSNRAAIGRAPNAALPGDAGEGMWGLIYALQLGLARVEAVGSQILKRLDDEQTVRRGRGGWLTTRAERLIDWIAVAILAAFVAWMAGFHR